MQTVSALRQLRASVKAARADGKSIALVPTMGGLHEGHLSLVKEAKRKADFVVATIFVNPAQFDRDDDFDQYPRTLEQDQRLLDSVDTDLLFTPNVSEIYPEGFQTKVSMGPLSEGLCGGNRPGHFDGVATVVTKLLLMALPDIALFGEKDYQQLMIIKRLVMDLNIPVEIFGCATHREADGLAMSSRNQYLTTKEREIAPHLHQVMLECKNQIQNGHALEPALSAAKETILSAGFKAVDYLELRHSHDLATAVEPLSGTYRLIAAAWLGKARIIDNIEICSDQA